MAITLQATTTWLYTPNLPAQAIQGGVTALSTTLTNGNSVSEAAYPIPTTAGGTVLPVGALFTSLGYGYFHNLDATNIINILKSTSGAILATLQPGQAALFPLPSDCTAPAAISLVAQCLLEYRIWQT